MSASETDKLAAIFARKRRELAARKPLVAGTPRPPSRDFAAALTRHRAGLPVNVRSLIRSSSTSGAASVVLLGRTEIPPCGHPASRTMSPSNSDATGVWLAGRTRIGLPAASAGATLCATRLIGKLNGVIKPAMPIGRR